MRFNRLNIFLLLLGLMVLPLTGMAQGGRDYILANQYMHKGEYEKAYDIFKELYRKDRDSQQLFEQTTRSLIQLKRYDEAIELSQNRLQSSIQTVQTRVRLGELYHLKGDTTRAFEAWNQALSQNTGNVNTYITVARTMKERGAYDRSIGVYRKAREAFDNATLFTREMANTYLQAGQYENAIGEFLDLVQSDPDRVDQVQRTIVRFDDDYLNDVAILEIEERLENMPSNSRVYRSYNELLVWTLMEKELYRRAFETAKDYEAATSTTTFSVFRLGSRFRSVQEYGLAIKAYDYYVSQSQHPLTTRSLHQQGDTYREWADYLTNYNIATYAKRDSLYRRAYQTYDNLTQKYGEYQNLGTIYRNQAELALDYLKDLKAAKKHYDKLAATANTNQNEAPLDYIDGRIKLFEGDFTRARVAFTRANKKAESSGLAEEARYYLGLTDFYSDDFEYAKLQLRALERENTSYYANDALKLRSWIQTGLQSDSTGGELQQFAEAHYHFTRGEDMKAIARLDTLIDHNSNSALKSHAMQLMSAETASKYPVFVYQILNSFAQGGSAAPLRERLLWERSEIAYRVNKYPAMLAKAYGDTLTADERFFKNLSEKEAYIQSMPPQLRNRIDVEQITIPQSIEEIKKLYRQLIMEYPQGYYASHARGRLRELSKNQSS